VKNFGIRHVSIVTDEPIDYDAARPLAVGARDVLDRADVVPSLLQAVSGCSLVAGTSRRLGQKRKDVSYTPWEFAAQAADRYGVGPQTGDTHRSESQTVAVVFGNERSGLSDEELSCCHLAVSIPTSAACPSLNLSHAVQLIAYELYKAAAAVSATGTASAAGTASATAPGPSFPTAARIREHADSIIQALNRLGFPSQEGPQGMRLFLRDLIARASLSEREAERLDRLFTKLAGMHGRSRERER
jgi:TrmH family RNA methyltransferase